MLKGSLKKKKEYSILLFIAICIVFFTAIFGIYRLSGIDTATYYVEDSADLALVSVTPYNESGVSEDSKIVITWNHAVSSEVGSAAEITPSVRGTWSVSGKQLIFTPQQLAAGTYYTVYIPKGTQMNNSGDVLQDDLYFSFETEDADLRIPDTESFSVGGDQYDFSTDDTIAIPVSCIATEDFDVDVSIYRADDSDAFISAFAPLFAYPSWAELTIEKYQASLRNFNKISDSAMSVQTKNGSSYVDLGSLREGQYLVRMSAAGSSYDVAVTVGGVDDTVFYDGSNLNIWCHQNGEALADGSVTVAGKDYDLDENGFVAVPYDADKRVIDADPDLLAVTISADSEDFVDFISTDKLTLQYTASLVVDKTELTPGDDLIVSGNITTATGSFNDDTITLALYSESGVLQTETVQTENGCFSYTWDALTLADGNYSVKLIYDGEVQATATFTVDTAEKELYLTAKSDVNAVVDGGKVTYTVTVRDANGATVDDAVVTMNGAESKNVDSNGKAQFSANYDIGDDLAVVQKDAEFSVESPYGEADDVTASVEVCSSQPFIELNEAKGKITAEVYNYTVEDGELVKTVNAKNNILISVYKDGEKVVSSASDEETASFSYSWDKATEGHYTLTATAGKAFASLQREVTGADSDVLSLLLEDGTFRAATEEESASYRLKYTDGTYTEPSDDVLSITTDDSITSENGENIDVIATVSGAERRITVVSLYQGKLPASAAGVDDYDESLGYVASGSLVANRVFFGDEAVNAVFSAENKNGDYFIRIWSQADNGETVSRYIPVTISGVSLIGAYDSCYEAGDAVSLPFYVSSSNTLNYTLTLNDDLGYTGECDGSFQVDTDITEVGNYSGTLVLTDEGKSVASVAVNFSVYAEEPVFYEVKSGYDKDAKLVYDVNEDDADEVTVLFQQALRPGDQILQQMSKTLFYSALGDDASYLKNDINYNLLSLQNSDGGFGRYISSESDLLLSVFVAAQSDFTYDAASLKSYLTYRLSSASDAETAALACWGLCCFGADCSDSMAEIAEDHALTERGKLYLAEGYLAAGDVSNAEKIYKQLRKVLIESDGKYYMPDSGDQYNIANTAFMLDISIKMGKDERNGILSYLLGSDIKIQTGRYLLELCILRMIDADDITLATTTTAEDGKTLLSLAADTDQELTTVGSKFYIDDQVVNQLSVGDTAKMEITWENEENDIYLIYIKDSSDISVIKQNNMISRKGYLEFVTAGNTATFYFKAEKAVNPLSQLVYVIDLTTGETVGYTLDTGIEVTK